MWQYSGRGLYYYISVIIRRSVVNIVSSELGPISKERFDNFTFTNLKIPLFLKFFDVDSISRKKYFC